MSKEDSIKCCWTCKHACWKDCLTPTGRFASRLGTGRCVYPVPEVPKLPWAIKWNFLDRDGKVRNPYDRVSGITPSDGTECECYDPTQKFMESGLYTVYEITKSFRGGSTTYYALLGKDFEIPEKNIQDQLRIWGEGTDGGYEDGWRMKWVITDKIPTKLNYKNELMNVDRLYFNPEFIEPRKKS